MQILNRVFSWWKHQTILVKLITGFFVLIVACCACSVPISIIAPNRTPTPQSAAQENPAATVVPDTSVPVDTPAPTNTPLPTNTPAPTNTPIPKLSFADIIQSPNEKGWTSTQYSTYFDTIKGQYVSGWSGTILEIDEYGGKPYLSLDMKPGEPKIDLYAYISENDVLKVGLGQNVTIAGTIDSKWPEDNDFYALQIQEVKLLLARQIDGMALEKKWLMEYPQCLYTAARRSSGDSHEPIGNDDSPD